MKLSVKLRPTVEGRSSGISPLLSPPPPILHPFSPEGKCFPVLGEDGEEGKGGKNPEDASDSVSADGEDTEDRQLDNNSNSTHSSRSSTPEQPPPASPVLLPPPPPPPPLITKDEHEMELMNKNSSAMMDISRNAVANPELTQAADDDEDDGDEDMSSSVATEDDTPLDFSVKRGTEDESTDDDRSVTPNGLNPPSISQDGALDLSVPRSRSSRSGSHLENPKHAKMAKLESALAIPSSPWGYNAPKHLPKAMVKATVVEVPMWNGKVKSEKRDKSYHSASSSKHSSLNRSNAYNPLMHKNASPPLDSMKVSGKGGSKNDPYRPAGRQNPWQSQWMSRSSEQTRDVFTCVWCKEAFRSLAEMTVHMKQSPRCGMAGMQNTLPSVSPTSTSAINHQSNMHQSPLPVKCSSSSTSAGPAANAVIKENVSLPRKLVRGQDVWLGKGAEQTRQILKCMWCGQSFKTLADMTTHMRVTQHYTNIISQEQIISWRTPEDKMAAQSQVNAVLTCKVCDQAFGSLKELSYHMVKNSHYKEHILRSITEGGGRRRQTRERRKKSLPVRKLLELERLELNKQNPSSSNDLINQAKNEVVDGKISCEECTEKVDAKDFVQHIKNCTQGSRSQHSVKSSPGSEGAKSTNADNNLDAPTTSGAIPSSSPLSSQELPSEDGNTPSKGQILHQEDSLCDSVESTGSTSVLNAIEKLIEKSFESKGRRNAVSTGILQRLGIDEEVYPPWHPSSSPSAFGALRSSLDFQRKSTSPLARMHDFKMDMADFSGSESRSRSSSTSEKHHSFDEHLRLSFGITAKDIMNRVSTPSSASQSCSPVNFQPESPADDRNAVFLTKEATNSNLASTSQAVACNVSPKARSVTPSSDRDNTEKISAKENEQQDEAKDTHEKDSSEKSKVNSDDKIAVSDDEKPIDCSSVTSPKSEERRTPLSRSSSCEPEAALPSSPPIDRVKEECSPSKHSRHISKKKRNSEIHRKSPSSNKRRSHSHRKRDADAGNNDGCDSVLGSPMSAHSVDLTSPRQKQHNDSAASDHPLKELQKLLDKTDAHLSRPNLPATPGSILAFSWACSEATTSDSLMKCAFCDTHFISKGAYRHHLSKMHFVKDGSLAEIAAASTWKPPTTSSGNSKTPPVGSNSSNGCAGSGSIAAGGGRPRNNSSDAGHPSSPPKEHIPPAPSDESPHSKFLKYTELAKQLSSKYV